MRVKCPICSEDLHYSQNMVEYGFIREDGQFLMLEYDIAEVVGDGISITCDSEDCEFALKDFPELEARIDSNIG